MASVNICLVLHFSKSKTIIIFDSSKLITRVNEQKHEKYVKSQDETYD